MYARSMPSMRQETIEDQLQILWRTLRLRGVTDQTGTLEDYIFALNDCSVEALQTTVNNLRAGRIEEASKEFSPSAPKLAEYVRAEQRRLDAINRPKAISFQPISRPWKDWKLIHRHIADDLAAKGFVKVAENTPLDTAVTFARRKTWRPGTRWFWAIQEAWEPRA
jgi:hypothetical protein